VVASLEHVQRCADAVHAAHHVGWRGAACGRTAGPSRLAWLRALAGELCVPALVHDIFNQVIYQADSNKTQAYRTYDNLGKNKEMYFRALGALPPGRKYFFVVGAQYNHNFYEGQYNGAPLNYKHGSWTLFTYQTLKLDKLTQLVINGFVRFKGQVQFYELSTFGSLNMSLNRQFLHKKLKVTASITDIFLSNNNTFTIDQGDIHATGLRKGDTRRVGLNVNYNFGIRKKEEHSFLNEESPENK